MRSIVVLAMHGAPPHDFPADEMAELFGLHGRLPHAPEDQRVALERRHAELDARVRAWPRTAVNDPFWAASLQLAEHLAQEAGSEVVVGFNEFCAPNLDGALDEAVSRGAERVVIVTPMMIRGGEHAEEEIPETVDRARGRHPEISFVYAWPFPALDVARFLAQQVATFE